MGEQCSKLPSFEDEEREVGPSGEYRRDEDGVRCFGRVCCQGAEDHDIDDDDDPLTYDMPRHGRRGEDLEMSVRTVSF